jgi:thiamine-monophosphate kinase
MDRYRRPEARLRLGVVVGRNRAAAACVDLSDGLADGIRQLGRASGTGARVEAEAVPVDPAAREWWCSRGRDPVEGAIAGGDDYELLFAVPRRLARRFAAATRLVRALPITRVGRMTDAPDFVIGEAGVDRPLPEGFSHFKPSL